ncbi:NUDIX hydrolase [Gordonia neofelifaecis]|uniref:NUDIX hydrolase n=1 Tax=Gordonia neofelifaecis NRRL B-59395 TaxID=644548 RepID=F1YF03_9ACTN|nr:NUDIX hydrolase [Gordonia neofelifaecis]EGD56986.1 NUDIX hydrolase [Gordonia neofelifaecis NRRL B-59395]
MSRPTRTVWAGGGVLWRPKRSADVEVALVHRPRYDDWSLPKGKAERGEILPVTAAREIVEETGYEVRMGHHLRTVGYRLGSGAPKRVGYWSVEAVGGGFAASRECDDLTWLPVSDAIEKVSYEADRDVLHTFASRPVRELHTLIVVRHASAGAREDFDGDDRRRPLDACGVRQSGALRELLALFGAHRLHAADRTRCVQTLTPLAEQLRTEVKLEPTLSEEAFDADPDAAYDRLRKLGGKTGSIHAICSQGGVIPPVLRRWAKADGVALPDAENRKGSVWVLTTRDGELTAADHIAAPLAG